MFRLFQIFSVICLHLVLPLILTCILTLAYLYAVRNAIGELEYIKYCSYLTWISPFIILAMALFLTYCYLSGVWFWISFIVLVIITIVYGFFIVMLRSINIQ